MAIVDLKMEKAIESFELHKSDQKEWLMAYFYQLQLNNYRVFFVVTELLIERFAQNLRLTH